MSIRWAALVARRRAEFRGKDRVLNIGHRGAAGLAPENTIAAIETAARAGADMVEIDVHLSPDGQLVVAHDFDEVEDRGRSLPLLGDCVGRARALALLVNVEIKNLPRAYPGIEERVVATLGELRALDEVLISSFDHESLAAVRRLTKEVATAVLTRDRLFEPAQYLERLDADALHPGGFVPDERLVASVRATGRGLNFWTANDPAVMQRLIAVGVTGVVTDCPNRLRDLLDSGDSHAAPSRTDR